LIVLDAQEVPAASTSTGGAGVLAALLLNEIAAIRERQRGFQSFP
jgi:hypothetical protein